MINNDREFDLITSFQESVEESEKKYMFVVILHSGSTGQVTEAGFNLSIFHYDK